MGTRASANRDYYKILGVQKKDNAQTIKKKFRALAREHHPDANSGSETSEEKFKLISEAYEILSDNKKRKEYDRMRSGSGSGPSSRRYSRQRGSGAPGDDPFDFGRKYQRQEQPNDGPGPGAGTGFDQEPVIDPDLPTRGFDLQFMVNIPFQTACLGGQISYNYDKHVPCTNCKQTGKTEDYETCPVCDGNTRVVENVTVDVEIPRGVRDQYTLRTRNLGGAGRNGGPPGDLLIKVCIIPDKRFKRVINDVWMELAIPEPLAETGGPLEIKTLDKTQTIEIEENTLTGEELRIRGAGAYEPWGKKRGDLIIKFRVEPVEETV
ncbi:MAG: DnaJ domain-containing protein [Candidatus Nitronauta litoralis]|uniref:DnaJ domain-containing protein n=1 Tax=Candidatus Nitronauta litoralis TaxID=2705533 RepID=A0A7T0BY35_9BACT|nr:MAG: DnaJ domain-containing protein [Candidatus Nitronauta litoralis]